MACSFVCGRMFLRSGESVVYNRTFVCACLFVGLLTQSRREIIVFHLTK